MTLPTETALVALLNADRTISAELGRTVLDMLKGRAPTSSNPLADAPDRVLSREEVAALIGKSVKSVDVYGRRGIFKRIYLTRGGTRRLQAQGYSRKSVLDAIRNGTATSDIDTVVDNGARRGDARKK